MIKRVLIETKGVLILNNFDVKRTFDKERVYISTM